MKRRAVLLWKDKVTLRRRSPILYKSLHHLVTERSLGDTDSAARKAHVSHVLMVTLRRRSPVRRKQ